MTLSHSELNSLTWNAISSSLPALTSVHAPRSPTHTHTHMPHAGTEPSPSTVSSTSPSCSRTLHYFVPVLSTWKIFVSPAQTSVLPISKPFPDPLQSYLVCALHLHSTVNRRLPPCLPSCFHNLPLHSSIFLIRHEHFKGKTMVPSASLSV